MTTKYPHFLREICPKKTWKLTWHWKQPCEDVSPAKWVSWRIMYWNTLVPTLYLIPRAWLLLWFPMETSSNHNVSSLLITWSISLGIQSHSQVMIRVSNHLRNAYYLGSSPIRKRWLDRQGMQQVVVVLFSNDVFTFGHLGSSGHLRAIFLTDIRIYGKNRCIYL